MLSETLIDFTISRFPRCDRGALKIHPLQKGGSDRNYYRVETGGGETMILVKYGDQREENRHYVSIAQFLGSQGIQVPRIYFHDEEKGLIWMEDLGEVDLWELRGDSWTRLAELYRRALDQAYLLHTRARQSSDMDGPRLEREFNAELYLWEQNYFFDNCLERYYKIDPALIALHRRSEPLEKIAIDLAVLPRVLVHRDFQSQNIMIRNGEAFLIDFQGLRPGLAQYDLASLIYDPYVALTPDQREELLAYYIRKDGNADETGFRRIFDLCAMQRLMQALGAYGFLGLVKERLQFLNYVEPAMASLREVVSRISGLQNLAVLLDNLPLNHAPCHPPPQS
ncbi:MAG TPA: phosphotransferase [Chthoniobacteraceae bacterium]|nr:phosphotransferase [Chthoniobacteraceae bacterium]